MQTQHRAFQKPLFIFGAGEEDLKTWNSSQISRSPSHPQQLLMYGKVQVGVLQCCRRQGSKGCVSVSDEASGRRYEMSKQKYLD
jgi:hypothetical protein